MKLIKSLFVLLIASSGLLAQPADKRLYINPQFGVNISGLTDELEGVSQSGKAGYNFGVDLRMGQGYVFFQPGVSYFQYNTKYTVVESSLLPDGRTTYETDVKVESIKARTLMGIRIFTTDLISIHANVGPAFNFPVNVDSDDDFVLKRGNYKDVTVGGVVGAGVDLMMFTFDLDYEFGLSDYVEFSNPNLQSSSSNQYTLTFCVGIRL
ncbi:outer membrane beta-barrel protein [Owenweeksia hongkongensis]|uniref:outer membrane beta-barrel protein n=1 Tax=Owenweeksia hongkongensis TaxID=253245 RepID=UPI003A94D7ED